MFRLHKTPLVLIAATLVAVALPVVADDAGTVTFQPRVDALAYVFHAEQLGWPSEVEARFEYRSGPAVLATDTVLLKFTDAATVRVPIVPSIDLAQTEDARVLVYAGDLLLADLDRGDLVDYNRVMNFTQPTIAGLTRPAAKIDCGSPCGGGCGWNDDYDCDGVINATDNCTDDPNSNQADCDGDGYGDVCDGQNATYQATGSVDTCMTDKDDHVAYKTFEHHVEQRQTDVSSCGAPDTWNRWVRQDNDCFNISDYNCCYGLRHSLSAVGDTYQSWCGAGVRNVDFCH
ncbi:MAG: hypothetical protein AAGE94_16480 [Acidobacteriota bacterium]